MKNKWLLFGMAVVLAGAFSSCKMNVSLSKQDNGDDVYYSLKDAKKDWRAEQKRKEDDDKRRQEEERKRQEQENIQKMSSQGSDYYNEEFDYDDYYDYEYAARIRRFNNPMSGNYYDNYYTNAYYYNNNPMYYGTSVYNSYGFWGPSSYMYYNCPQSYMYWNNGWGWGTGWGHPHNMWGWNDPWMYNGWGYNGWGYNPYYAYNPYWGGGWYGPGYNWMMGSGFGNGGWGSGWGNNGWGNNYFNSFDNNSFFYGPRTAPGSNDGRTANMGGTTFGERFVNSVVAENQLERPTNEDVHRAVVNSLPASSTAPAGRPVDNGTNLPANPYNPGQQVDGRGTVPPPPAVDGPANTSRPVQVNPAAPTPAQPNFDRPSSPNVHPAPSQGRPETPRSSEPPRESRPRMSDNGGGGSSFPSSSPSSSGGSSRGGSSTPASRPR
ncbi:MAG: hypothetical protein LW750_07040 [Bacteroidetes bacterium]|nr:hypothetical protein [Bacteroidota bacterium]